MDRIGQRAREKRSLYLVAILTAWSLYSIERDPFPPRGNPLIYNLAMSWLMTITSVFVVVVAGAISKASHNLFSLTAWEKDGEVYERAGIRPYRWLLFHSPLRWLNTTLDVRSGRADCDRLLKELNNSEGVHWLSGIVLTALAIVYLLTDRAAYGYPMLLLRVPFDVYPIMLQRWNRGRVQRIRERLR